MATTETDPRTEARYRKAVRHALPPLVQVESVAWVKRRDNEFAALVIPNGWPETYERVLELLTDPHCPFTTVREYEGSYDTRIYIAFTA